jgi:biotin carboxyl carrier protein
MLKNSFLICSAQESKTSIEIKSPAIGRIIFFLEPGCLVVGGQLIGNLYRLEQIFLLSLDKGCSGKIIWAKNHNVLVPVAYGEVILKIDRQPIKHLENNKCGEQEESNLPADYIHAPMDGMFYLSPSPTSPPFVKIEDEIKPGQTLGLIEVMKSFYPFKYQGKTIAKIIEITIKNAMPIKSGTRLFKVIKK